MLSKEERGKIIDRIRKCFAKADTNHNDNEHEVRVAMDSAQRLMNEYHLTMVEVQFDSERNTLKQDVKESATENRWAKRWERALTHVVCILLPVKNYIRNRGAFGRRSQTTSFVFVGLEDDAALAVEIYETLRKEVSKMAARRGFTSNGHLKNSYCQGVIHTMVNRAKENRDRQQRQQTDVIETRCTALIVLKDKAVAQYYSTLHLVSSRAAYYTPEQNAYGLGRQDGHRVNLDFTNKLTSAV